MWAISIRNLPIAFLHNLRYLPGNNHATRPVTTLAPQNEPPASKRHRFTSTQKWLHETNMPLTTPLSPPTRTPPETAITPTLDIYVPALPHEDDGNAPTLAPPQTPLLTPHGHPPRHPHIASTQTPQATPTPLRASPASKRPMQDSQPLASPPPHATPHRTTPAPQNEPPPNKSPRLYTTRQWLCETNRPSAATLNPPTSPTASLAMPTFDDHNPFPAHGHVRLAPAYTAPQPPPFRPSICIHTHRISHHHKHHTWRLLYYLPHLPSNTQGQTRRLLPHVCLKTPYAQTPHPLNHLKLMTPRRQRRRNQDIRPELETARQVKLILSPKQRATPAASRTRTCTNAAVSIASGECPSRF
jgi:hypothetical protein